MVLGLRSKERLQKVLNDYSERGNLDKHQGQYYILDAKQLAVVFSIAKPQTLKILDEITGNL